LLSPIRVFVRTAALAAVLGAHLVHAQAPPPPLNPIALTGDAERGSVLAETCRGCHGVPGAFNAYPAYRVPKLGGQNADYIEVALQGYRRGTRSHPTMQAQAATLSDQDIADLAAYFAGVPGEAETGKSSGSAMQVAEGREKAMTCVQCHGQEGVAAAAQWPNLAGQHESYLLQAMTEYKTGGRNDMLMGPLVADLDEPTLESIAAFFAAQPLLHSTPRQ
jgi:cytochrome c553